MRPQVPPAPPPGGAPPALARWLLQHLLPVPIREAFLGDLEEHFRGEVLPARGLRAARRWYWRETLRAPLTLPSLPASRPALAPPSGDGPMTTLLADLRFALRLLARQPGFTAVVSVTLALGIGATAAIFSVVRPVLFAPLPYPDPDRVVMVWEREPDGKSSNVGFATFRDVADQSRSFQTSAAIAYLEATMTGRAEPERLQGDGVSYSYFRTLGVAPALGRDFTAFEDRPGAERVIILSHGLWQRRFGGDSALVGRQITLDGHPYTVVGVMPASFENLLDPGAQAWSPLRYDVSQPWACRTCRHLRMVARLKPGVRLAEAASELEVISRRMVADHPTEYQAPGMLLPTLRQDLTRGVRPALLAVLGAVALLLLAACTNVINLLLARAAQRREEFAVRAALGAGHHRLGRQLLTESLLLAGVGGGLGLGVAWLGVRALVALSPADLPRLDAIGLNGPVLLFALAVTTLVGVIFGLAPALQATRRDVYAGLREGGRRATAARHRTRAALVVSEVAFALMLLTGSGLLLRSMERLLSVSPGFDPDRLLTLKVMTGGPRFATDTATWAFFDQTLAAVRAVPGVEAAGFTSQLPLSGDFDRSGVHVETHPRPNPEDDPSAHRYAVSPGYLEAMRIPVLRGRSLTPADRRGQPLVVLVSQSFARREWPGEDPIGQRVRVAGGNPLWRTVVGIVGDVTHVSLAVEPPNAVYLPENQWNWADPAMSLVVRARGEPARLVPALRRAIWALDKDQPIVRITTMSRLVAASAAQRRFTLVLFEAFGATALALAAAGIYGVLSEAVAERRRELGVRAALGASRARILLMTVRQGLGLTTVGTLLGLGAAALLTRLIEGLLFGVPPLDPATYAGVAALLLAVAAAACWVPAWRAARVDPVVVLRAE